MGQVHSGKQEPVGFGKGGLAPTLRFAGEQMGRTMLAAVQNRDHSRPDLDVMIDEIASDQLGGLIACRTLQTGQFLPCLIAIPVVAGQCADIGKARRLHRLAVARRTGHAEIKALGGDIGGHLGAGGGVVADQPIGGDEPSAGAQHPCNFAQRDERSVKMLQNGVREHTVEAFI